MFTRCPNCNSAFSITGQQLVIAAGMVRCGICEHVFDARPHLFQEPSAPPDIQPVIDSSPPSSQDELTEEVEETKPEENKQEKLSDDDFGLIKDFPEPDDEFVEEEIVLQQTGSTQANDVEEVPKIIADDLSYLEDQPKSSKGRFLGIIFTWFLLALLAIQATAVYKPDVFPENWQDKLCKWLTCVEHLAREPKSIEILNRSVHTHPHEDNALLATLTIVNRAEFAQAYPIIQLRFLDTSGGVIAARLFDANQYLGSKWRADSELPPNTPISIKLEVKDTGQQVVSYDFEFL